MKKENMKENKKVNSKEIRLNVNFIELVNKIKIEKLENVNKEKLKDVYEENMGLKFNNCERVIKRVNRNMLNEVRKKVLSDYKISESEFKEISNKLIRESKERKSSNYLSVSL